MDENLKEILIKFLIQMAIDEEKKKKALIFIVSVVTGLLMLIAFFILNYKSFRYVKQFIFGDEILAIEQFQKDYGDNQSIGIYDKDYIEAD